MEKILKITGMTCSACAGRIERAMNKLEGIDEAKVNFASEKLYVTYNEDMISEENIVSAIVKAGYDFADENTKEKMPPHKVLLIRFIVSAIFALPLLVVTMGHMFGMPLPEILSRSENPLNFSIMQLCLTVPVMITGYMFYF